MAQTNVQAFSGDVEISSNLAVNTDVLFVDTVGNKVGIGTTNPQEALHVAGNIRLGAAEGVDDDNLKSIVTTSPLEVHSNAEDLDGLGVSLNLRSGFSDSESNIQMLSSKSNSTFQYISFATATQERMRIDSAGNVGIGLTNPSSTLDVKDAITIKNYEDTGFSNVIALSIQAYSSDYTSITNGYGSRIQFRTNRGTNAAGSAASADIKGYVWSGGGSGVDYHGLDIDVYGDNSSLNKGISILSASNSGGPAKTIMHGRVGIGTTNPGYIFHVFRDADLFGNNVDEDTHLLVQTAGQMTIQRKHGSTLKAEISSNMSSQSPAWVYYKTSSDNWRVGYSGTNVSGSNNSDFKFFWLTTVKAFIDASDGTVEINFTGQHRTFIDGVPTSESGDFIGLIVSADKNKYMKMSKGVEMGSNAITINESLPLVSLSNVAHDKACFGVISDAEDSETRKDSFGSLVTVSNKEKGDTRVYINSVGEGAIWVTDINGTLESGDYITTSNVAGYGQKQDSEFLANYTVAKITMDCDFEPVTQPIQVIKRELGNVNYWVKTTYENVSEEEYSNLAEENRQIVDGVYQKITKEESKTEQEGYELEVRQELVNVLDEHGQIQWEDDPSGATEKAYKIRYLDADGNITDEANAVHKAAFVGCTYHCG
jgi:hypothetical protein